MLHEFLRQLRKAPMSSRRSRGRRKAGSPAHRFRPALEHLEGRVVPATHFGLSGFSGGATAGAAGTVAIQALNANGTKDTSYTGTVYFTSSDAKAVLPADTTLSNGSGTVSVTLKTSGLQTLKATDKANSSISGSLTTGPQSVPVYVQPPSASGGVMKSAWYPPDGLDGDSYAYESFVLNSTQSITRIDWRGGYTNNLSGAGESPVYDFTISIYPSIAAGIQPDVTSQPLAQYTVGGNAGETSVGTVGGIPMYSYHYNLPTAFQAKAGTKYWVQIEASQGLTPNYYWPPDWGWAYGTGSDGSHFQATTGGTNGGGTLYQMLSGDLAFTLRTTVSGPGVYVSPAATSQLVVSGFPTPVKAGTAGSFTVSARDAYGNLTPGFLDKVHFTSTDSKAVLPADYAFTATDAGMHKFNANLKTAGVQSLTATDTATSSITGKQTGITVTPAAATHFSVSTPTSLTAGQTFSITVTALDAYNNTATGYLGTVHFTSTDAQAVLPADYTFVSSDKGKHTFTNGATLKTAASQKITAADTVSTSIKGTGTTVVNPAAASHLVVAGFPSSATAGVAYAFTVTAVDTYGNVATGYLGTVHFTSTDSLAVLPADFLFTAAAKGKGSFKATLKTPGKESLTATDLALASITGTEGGIVVA